MLLVRPRPLPAATSDPTNEIPVMALAADISGV